ncbi:MAG: IclR family transcriptional regulator [Rhizobiales bacterium]|nr:IclR family transcriptional regulator [Hyphomicrobiales bacterium]
MLECLARRGEPLGLTEIAAALDMSKSSVHELLATLDQRKFVTRLPDQRYVVGIKAWEIGCLATPLELARTAAPHMAALARAVSEGIALAIRDGAEMVCIQLAESPQAVRVHNMVGDRNPAHCVSTGLALLAALTDGEIAKLLPEELQQATPETIGSRVALLEELARIRRRGYAVNRSGWRSDVAGVAVVVRGPDSRAAAALSIATLRDRMTEAWLEQTVPLLRAAAADIERALGVPVAEGLAEARVRPSLQRVG